MKVSALWKPVLAGCLAAIELPALFSAEAPTASSAVTITLGTRHGHATPERHGFSHTGGGVTDVAQPTADSLVITQTGVAVAGAHPCKDSSAALDFDLTQEFEVTFEKPEIKKAKISLEARVIGLLRSECKGGSAEVSPAHAVILKEDKEIAALTVQPHSVGGGENLSINDHEGPKSGTLTAGTYTLSQTFHIGAAYPRTIRPAKAASSEFAPDPALDPLWISAWEPFHGASKKDFGFQLTVKISPE